MSDIIRRDPRRQWIARNRLHPLHPSMAPPMEAGRGPSGLLRKNPHGVGFIGPNGIKRIDRLAGNGLAQGLQRHSASSVQREVELPLQRLENPNFYVAVVVDMVGGRLTGHDKDVLGQAHQLADSAEGGGAVVAVVFGAIKETAFDRAGIDRLVHLQGPEFENYAPEQRLAALVALEGQYQPRYWLLPDSINGAGELGRRLAAKLGERPATQVWQVDADMCRCRAASGRRDITRRTPRLLLLAEECANPVDETRHEVLPLALESIAAATACILDQGRVTVDPSAIPLAEAEFILSAGNGIQDWAQFHQAAELLGATEGASRVAVDDGFMPRFSQVGATGTWVTARVYVAVGISGAVQHIQGLGQCDKVIAINIDTGCDMVKRANLAVIGDSQKILAELMELVVAHRERAVDNAA